jgi:predicted branched-subunit amino acid permease
VQGNILLKCKGKRSAEHMRALLMIAVAVFAIWLIFTLIGIVLGGLIHLLWIVILVALVIWAIRFFARGRQRTF